MTALHRGRPIVVPPELVGVLREQSVRYVFTQADNMAPNEAFERADSLITAVREAVSLYDALRVPDVGEGDCVLDDGMRRLVRSVCIDVFEHERGLLDHEADETGALSQSTRARLEGMLLVERFVAHLDEERGR